MDENSQVSSKICKLSKSYAKNQLGLPVDKNENKYFPKVSKKLVRNTEVIKPNVDVKKTIASRSYLKHNYCQQPTKTKLKHEQLIEKSLYRNNDITKPGLCTSLKIADDIIKTITSEKNQSDCIIISELEPSSNLKVLKKVNIPFTEKIYKGLINLEISDEDLYSGKSSLPLKKKEFSISKDKVPMLSDYYQPLFLQEYKIEKQVPHFNLEKIKYYNGNRITDKVKAWEVIDQV